MLSIKSNFLFIHVPKTGGNSIQHVLLPYSEDEMVVAVPFQDGINRFGIRSRGLNIQKHSSLEDYRKQLDPETFSRLIKITCVRNPWDRCVSFFFSPHRGQVTWSPEAFETFIRSSVMPHRDYLALQGQHGDPFDNVDVVLRFESLDDDFEVLCHKLGIPSVRLPKVNASAREHYRSYYQNRHCIDLVAERFSLEISRFGYSF